MKDYFQICKSYFDAVKTLPPSQIETIDMGPLSDELLNKIPYKSGEYVSSKHSNGHNIVFSVNSKTTQEIFHEDLYGIGSGSLVDD